MGTKREREKKIASRFLTQPFPLFSLVQREESATRSSRAGLCTFPISSHQVRETRERLGSRNTTSIDDLAADVLFPLPPSLPILDYTAWLDGSMVGDRGFDPLGLSKPTEFIQMDLDALDQNKAVNKAGGVVGTITPDIDQVSGDSLSPYSEAFGIQRFRECELIHGRWCMLATLGIIVGESATGVSWQNAGEYILNGGSYAGLQVPFDVTQTSYIEAILMLGVEVLRNTERDLEKRCYPGGYFDPLGFASDSEKSINLKEAEIRHCRLAMVAMFGLGTQALLFNKGCLESLTYFGNSFSGGN